MQKTVKPSPGSIEHFLKTAPGNTGIVMLNLIRYRATAVYPSDAGHALCSGREAYQRYQKQVLPLIQAVEAKVLWFGHVQAQLIAPAGEEWEEAFLVQYPSKEAFVHMISQPAYEAAHVHRLAALDDSRLIATTNATP